MTFKLYNVASGGSALYTEVQPSVAVSNGSFNAVIGAVSPISLPFDVPYWLTVTINADPEMSPRQPLASSPYALRALSLDATATIPGSSVVGPITVGQAGGSVFGTGPLTVTPTTSSTVIPGLTTTITVPSAAVVLLTTDGSVQTTSSVATGFSIVDIFLSVDTIVVPNGGYQRVMAASSTALIAKMTAWSLSQVVTVAAGSHTFAVRAAGVNTAGAVDATVSGNNTSVNQGTLTAVVLKL